MTILILPGALLLGVLSWALGGAALFGRGRGLPTLSLSCCALALLLACVDFVQQVREGDWSALMDTSDATLFAAAVLTVVALILNGTAWAVARLRSRHRY